MPDKRDMLTFSPAKCGFMVELVRTVSSSDIGRITAEIGRRVEEFMGFRSMFVLVADLEELALWEHDEFERLKVLDRSEIEKISELRSAINDKKALLIDGEATASDELKSILGPNEFKTALIVPMVMDEEVFGAGIYWGEGRLALEEVTMLEVVTCIAGGLLSNAMARKLLQEVRTRYMTVIDVMNKLDASVVIAQDERIKYANDKTVELTGYSKEELYSIPIHRLISPRDRERIINNYRKRITGEKVEEEYGFWMLRKDGKEIFLEGIYSTIPFRGKKAVIAILRDATEKRKLEQEAERTRRLESLRVLTGGLAHNFNNLLCGIMGNASLIKFTVSPDDPSYRRAEAIEKLSQRGAELVYQLLIFARKLEEEHETIDLNRVVEEKLIDFKGKLNREDIRFDFHPSLSPLPVKIPPSAFSFTLESLLENAVEAMPNGGRVKVELSEREDMAVLTVVDEGKGIKREHIDKVFDPFFSTKDLSKGAGLGLSLVHAVVSECGGRVSISSSEGGTTVTINLPIFKSEARLGGRERYIMIVSEIQGELISEALRSEGFNRLLIVSTGETACELFDRFKEEIKLVILDISLPSAKEIFSLFKGRMPSLRVIIISNDPEDEKLLEIGGVRVLPKPIPLDGLIQLVKSAMGVEGVWI